jgi:hypothetical protein
LRLFLSRQIPEFTRVLLVESGSREVTEKLLGMLRERHGERVQVDLVTCFPGSPEGFSGKVFRVSDYAGPAARGRLYRELAERHYPIAAILCTGEKLMTKWKWSLALRLPSKIWIVNENADAFWIDYGHRANIARFVRARLGLSGAAAIPALARVLFFPISLAYLLLFAAAVHFRRKLRTL